VNCVLEDVRGERRIDPSRFPLAVGGPDADLALPGSATETLAYLGTTGGELFVQPASGRVSVNGTLVTTSHWLRAGDEVRVGTSWLDVLERGGSLRIRVRREDRKTDPPVILPRKHVSRETDSAGSPIDAVDFQPKNWRKPGRERRAFHPASLLVLPALAILGAALWFVLTARSVGVEIEPGPDRFSIEGNLVDVPFGGRFLLRPGTYRVVAEKEGFRKLEQEIVVSGVERHDFRFTLSKLPGRLVLRTTPDSGAAVSVDGSEVGTMPLEPIELEAGEHAVRVTADRYRAFESRVQIEGEGSVVELDVALEPRFATVTFVSEPPGATVRVANGSYGPAPVEVELLEGNHEYEALLPGRKPERGRVRISGGERQTVRLGDFAPVDGVVTLLSVPGEANVTVDGEYRGRTPLELALAPGRTYRVELARAGYEAASREMEVASGTSRTITVALEARLGEVDFVIDPPDAELYVNGERRGPARQLLRLPAVAQRIEIRKEGYESFSADVTPRPDFPQTVEVSLVNLEAKQKAAVLPKRLTTSQAQELVLVEPLRFQMGASRREPGRRANEAIREIEITRPFYISTMEITNRQFREFKKGHRSGVVQDTNLETDHHPVVRVSWEDAAAYCNWLSASESLPPAYVASGSTYVLDGPRATGYRLPTEAEWERAARYASGVSTKYPWGESLPIPKGAGNFADAAAAGLVAATLPGYEDGFAGTSPVDSFGANPLGIFNLGGNVAEWVQDRYAISPSAERGEVERDPLGPEKGEFHVIRGASFLYGNATQLRLSYRDYGKEARPDVGFRIARFLE
jgi:formylglycine-generating enzyme required for sulfatase activity